MNTNTGLKKNVMAAYNILVVEDDAHVARLIESNLQKVNMECRRAPDGKSALVAFAQKTPHLVLLDLGLPDMTGFEICAKMRRSEGPQSRVPIIMLTARDAPEDQLHGLKVGADDYVTKPFDPKLLMARVAAQLRRVHHYNAADIALSNAAIHAPAMTHTHGAAQLQGATAAQNPVPANWTRCADCNYLGPNEKFEELSEQFTLIMMCPHCGTRLKQEYAIS